VIACNVTTDPLSVKNTEQFSSSNRMCSFARPLTSLEGRATIPHCVLIAHARDDEIADTDNPPFVCAAARGRSRLLVGGPHWAIQRLIIETKSTPACSALEPFRS
jgi:hypothetical protein